MPGDLSVPIGFRLPEGWVPAPPDEVGLPDAAFVALCATTQGTGFTANIVVEGEVLDDGVELHQLADESLRRLRSSGVEVRVDQRTPLGVAAVPGLSQDLRLIITSAGGKVLELVQCQFYLAVPGVERRALVRVVLTAAQHQFSAVIDDFREFLSTIELDDRT